jgi:DNA-binding NarL/FixJ family response regulator
MTATPARLLVRVCHGDPLAVAGLAALIGREADFDVQAARAADGGIVDVIVADHPCALSLLASAAAFDPSTPSGGFRVPRIVVVTSCDKEADILDAIESGAHGYLLEDASSGELMEAIRHVARGGALYLCKRTAMLLWHSALQMNLTTREADALRSLVKT